MIVQHIRRQRGGRRVKVGTLVAVSVGDNAAIGFSKCKITGENADKFDPELGVQIAKDRAIKVGNGEPVDDAKVPQSIQKDVAKFTDRAERYFKNQNVMII